ncbi:hypothetical protein [Streptomyces sp. NPDC047000]|uniref:DUF6197 family protein n=1 Tax=Streptomyces sp. NPDC047000 TaxID=3155474 RepID=UPI0033DCE827
MFMPLYRSDAQAGATAVLPTAAPAAPDTTARIDDILRRSALLIAQRGWCQGRSLHYVGSPHDPHAASLVGALTWAATGDAHACHEEIAGLVAHVRTRLDPENSAFFDDLELLWAWNDAPARTRDQVVALLLSCRHAGTQPVAG